MLSVLKPKLENPPPWFSGTKKPTTDFDVKPEETVTTIFEAKPEKTVAIGFEVKLEKTVATGFEARPEKIVPMILRSNH
jgi:hypothetical protein